MASSGWSQARLPEKPIEVQVTPAPPTPSKHIFNEVTGVGVSGTVNLLNQAIPAAGETWQLLSVKVGGCSVGTFTLFDGATTLGKFSTTWDDFYYMFDFRNSDGGGIELTAGNNLIVTVLNDGENIGQYDVTATYLPITP